MRSVAHANGVRGGDLAEALGLPRYFDKELPLVEMDIDREQLDKALASLIALPDPVQGKKCKTGEYDTSMTIRQIAKAIGIKGAVLAHDLKLDVSVDKDIPVAQFGVSQDLLDRAVLHNTAHEESSYDYLKYPISVLIVLFALLYLLKWGIPTSANKKERKFWYPRWVFILVLLITAIVLGFALGKSPNPMEGAVKFFKATVGLYESVGEKLVLMAFFLALAAVANKAICGWACPFGALEELLYMLPLFKRIKKKKLPFWLTNSVRTALFVVFILYIYGLVGGMKGYVSYHYVNPFNLFNADFSTWTVPWAIAGFLLASLFFYRPFCQFVCPFGFLSWIVERISLTRVRIDSERCIACGSCEKACPLNAAGDRLKKKLAPADCFSCMRCLRVCPSDAIHYQPSWGPPSPDSPAEEKQTAGEEVVDVRVRF